MRRRDIARAHRTLQCSGAWRLHWLEASSGAGLRGRAWRLHWLNASLRLGQTSLQRLQGRLCSARPDDGGSTFTPLFVRGGIVLPTTNGRPLDCPPRLASFEFRAASSFQGCRMASRSKKRARSTPPQPSAALARLEMLAGSVLDAYGATNSFDKDGEAELELAADELRRQKVPRSPKAKERSKHAEPSSSSDSAPAEAQSPPARVPTVKQLHLRDLSPPPISVLREAGYLETDDTVRRLWAWVKSHEPDDLVWPTPTAGVQVPRYTPAPQPALPRSPAPQPCPTAHAPHPMLCSGRLRCSAPSLCTLPLHPPSAPSFCTLALHPPPPASTSWLTPNPDPNPNRSRCASTRVAGLPSTPQPRHGSPCCR